MHQETGKRTAALTVALVIGMVSVAMAQRPGHTRQIETLAFRPDGKTLVSGGHDGKVSFWDARSGQRSGSSDFHRLIVSGLAFSADGTQMASASWDSRAVVWTGDRRAAILEGHEDTLHDVAITADGKRIATSSNDKTIRLWDARSGEQLRKHQFVDPVPDGLAFSPDGRTLAVGTKRNTVVLFDIEKWAPTATLSVSGNAGELRFVNDGKHLLVGTSGVERWDITKRQKVQHYKPRGRAQGDFGADSAGRVIAGLSNNTVTVWPDGKPDQSKTLPNSNDGTAVAVSPDGKHIAMGRMNGGLIIWDTAKGEVLYEIAPGERPAPPESPDKPIVEMLGKDVLAPDQRDRWRMQTPTDAIRWVAPDGNGGLSFVAASIPTHLVGNDVMTAATGVGNRAFDLTFDVMIEQTGGPHFFTAGLAIGMSSAPVDYMSKDDISAVVALHLDGIFAGVTRGEPYAMHPAYMRIDANAIARAGAAGRKNVIPWSRASRGTFTRDLPVRIRVRREVGPDPAKDHAEMRHQLVFTMWVPSAGQSYDQPWRRWTWTMPDEMRDKPLDHLFIKRIHVTGDHLGAQGTGYGEYLRIKGWLANMKLRADPPTITSVSGSDGESGVLKPGDRLDIRGAGFNKANTVSIGGKPAGDLEQVSASHLRVTIPELAPGRSYDIKVEQPDTGLADLVEKAVPVGRFVTEATLVEASPEGGDVVDVSGFGLDEATEVRIGDDKAEVVDVTPTTLRVKVPAGEAGAAPITARHPDAEVHGSIRFAYTVRPSIWFTAEELKVLRDRSMREPWKAYREKMVGLAEGAVGLRPGRAHGRSNSAPPVFWAYVLTGEQKYRNRALDWIRYFLDEPRLGEWYYEEAYLMMVGYELLRDEMDTKLRSRVQQHLLKVLDHYIENDAHGSWFAANPTSTNPMVNSSAVPLALMFEHVHEGSDEVVETAKGFLTHYIDLAISPDGAWTEGMSWATTGLSDYLDVARLLARHREDTSLLGRDRLAKATRMYEVMTASPTDLITYNNMHHGMKGAAVAAHLDARYDKPLMRWVADASAGHVGRGGANELARALMWRSAKPAVEAPELPILAAIDDVHWVTMRSHGRADAPLLVGLKGIQNGPQPYHQQSDTGSFTIYARGEPLVVDPGWGQSSSNQHSIPLIDGRGPDKWGAALTDTHSHGSWRAAVVDATDAYHWKTGATRVRRTVAMHREGAVVVLDDIAPHRDRPGKVAWKLQTLVADLAEDRLIKVAGKNAAMTAKLFGPEVETSSQQHRKKYQEIHWHTVTADYNAAPDRPLVTVFEVAAGTEPPAIAAEVTYEPDRITVELARRGKLVFRKIGAGWGLVKPGGEGDEDLLLTPTKLQPRPRVVAVRAAKSPKLDGKLDDAVWRSANAADGFKPTDTWNPGKAAEFPTEAKFAWDDENLYLAIRAYEPNLEGIVSTMVGPAQSLMGDDHIQFYLDIGREYATNRYFGYNFPASGMHMGVYGKMGDIGSTDLTIAEGRETGEQSAWTLEVAIPWSTLLTDNWRKLTVTRPVSGLNMAMNLQRYRMQKPEETSMWSRSEPSLTGMPWRWGTLVLE